jgi:hypothetical protein
LIRVVGDYDLSFRQVVRDTIQRVLDIMHWGIRANRHQNDHGRYLT